MALPSTAAGAFDQITGYRPWTDRTTGDLAANLQVDLIQQAFENAMVDKLLPAGKYVTDAEETCEAFKGPGTDFWNDNSLTKGGYFRNLPTWKAGSTTPTYGNPGRTEDLVGVFYQFYGPTFLNDIVQASFDASTVTTPTVTGCSTGGVTLSTNIDANFCNQFCNAGDTLAPVSTDALCFNPDVDLVRNSPARALGGGNYNGGGACVGYEEIAKKVTSYTGFKLEFLSLMQKAIDLVELDDCLANPTVASVRGVPQCWGALSAWDAAVAVYSGSLELADGTDGQGKTPYSLNQKRCANFGTCGPRLPGTDAGAALDAVSENSGGSGAKYGHFDKTQPSNSNMVIMEFFTAGAQAIYNGNFDRAKQFKRLIADQSIIGNLQGAYRYYWRMSDYATQWKSPTKYPLLAGSSRDKEVGEGWAFVIGALPPLWSCSKKAFNKLKNTEMFDLGADIPLVTAPTVVGGDVQAATGGPGTAEFQNFNSGNQQSGVPPGLYQGNLAVNLNTFDVLKRAFECQHQCLGITCKSIGELYDGDIAIATATQDQGPRTGTVQCKDIDTEQAGLVCQKLGGVKYNSRCKSFKGSPGNSTYNNFRAGKISGNSGRLPGFWLA